MSDLRARVHAAAAAPDDELDTDALARRVTRRRRRRASAVAAAAFVVVLAAGGGVLAAQRGTEAGSLKTSGGSSTPTGAPTTPDPTSPTSWIPSTTDAPETTIPVGPGTTNQSAGWRAAPTTGLANFDDVTVTAAGIPDGSYDVGQCPAGHADDASECLLNDVVAVSDGRLTAKVRAFWWMSAGRVDCGAAAGACVVGVQSTDPHSTFAPVSFALAFDPAKRPRIEITPADGLDDGQHVEVRGVNIGAGSVSFAECLRDRWATCQYADATSGSDGDFTTTFAVERVLHWMYQGDVDESAECGVDGACVIEVWVRPNGFENFDATVYRVWIEPDHPVALTFTAAPPTTTTTTGAP